MNKPLRYFTIVYFKQTLLSCTWNYEEQRRRGRLNPRSISADLFFNWYLFRACVFRQVDEKNSNKHLHRQNEKKKVPAISWPVMVSKDGVEQPVDFPDDENELHWIS